MFSDDFVQISDKTSEIWTMFENAKTGRPYFEHLLYLRRHSNLKIEIQTCQYPRPFYIKNIP